MAALFETGMATHYVFSTSDAADESKVSKMQRPLRSKPSRTHSTNRSVADRTTMPRALTLAARPAARPHPAARAGARRARAGRPPR
eukprot:631287-Prymnesium_polylepis.1